MLLKGEHKAIFSLPPSIIFLNNPQKFKWNPCALPFCNLIGQEAEPVSWDNVDVILSHMLKVGSRTIPYVSLLLATPNFFFFFNLLQLLQINLAYNGFAKLLTHNKGRKDFQYMEAPLFCM